MSIETPNAAFYIALQSGVCGKAEGMPGVAKSACIYSLGRATGRNVICIIGSLREPADIGGYPHPGKRIVKRVVDGREEQREINCMELIPTDWVVDILSGGKWILFLDEITSCPPAVQAAMLRIIAERYVGSHKLPGPDDLWICAACNPPDIAANGYELEAPMSNRMCHLPWKMDWDSWDRGMMNGLNFPAPNFPILPENWRDKHLGEIAALVRAFRNKRPGLFEVETDMEGKPQIERAKLGGAYPSPRAWTMAALCKAGARSVKAGDSVELELVAGCVGSAAQEFAEWERHLDLPDPEEMIQDFVRAAKKKKGGKGKYVRPNRPDKVIALLGGVAHAVASNATEERWHAGMSIIEAAADHDKDIALTSAQPLMHAKPAKAHLTEEFVNKLYPTIKRCLMD